MALGCTGIRTRQKFVDQASMLKAFSTWSSSEHSEPIQQNNKVKWHGISELSQVRRHLFQKVAKRTLPSKSELLDGAVLKASKGWRVVVFRLEGCGRMPHNWQAFTQSSSLFKPYRCTDFTRRTAVSELLPKLEKLRLELYQAPDIQFL